MSQDPIGEELLVAHLNDTSNRESLLMKSKITGIVGYTTGVFDLFHIGHMNILKNAKERCERLIVGVATDPLAEQLKGKRPIIPYEERIDIVRSIKYVDLAVPYDTPDRIRTWMQLRFDVMFKGDDWKGSAKGRELEKLMDTVGVRVVYFPYTKQTSSTILRTILEESREVIDRSLD